MANPDHVMVVRQGTQAVREWRRSNPSERLDLSGASLPAARLDQVDLSGARLSGADLRGASLREARLAGSDLSGANLQNASLVGSDLSGANLSKAILTGASLNNARLVEANLCSAFMVGTQLVEAELSYANLTGAALIAAVFLRTSLCGTNFSRAILRSTWFSSVDLSQAKGLRTVASHGRVLLGVDTLITSIHGAGDKLTVDLKTFFRCGGLPQELLRALPRLLAAVQYDDCFICYGQSDLKFAEKLCDDLIARGVSCWLYEMDRTPGKWTWREIGEQRRSAEKMVVACSSNALVRDGVLKEIEEQIDDDPDKMVPVSLDGLWREPGFKVMRGNRNLKPFLEDRNWADFSRWESDAAHYEQAVGELLRGLRRKSGRTAKTA